MLVPSKQRFLSARSVHGNATTFTYFSVRESLTVNIFAVYLDPTYLDGTVGYPRGFDPLTQMRSAHSIAREAFESLDKDKGNVQKPHSTSILFMSFGQFIDHDVTITSHAPSGLCSPK